MSTVLNGKVALVTGGGSGIGRATAQKFAALGASVVVADIDEASAIECARQISDDGGEASAWQADVSKGDAVRAMVRSEEHTSELQSRTMARTASPSSPPSPDTGNWTTPSTTPVLRVRVVRWWSAPRRTGPVRSLSI